MVNEGLIQEGAESTEEGSSMYSDYGRSYSLYERLKKAGDLNGRLQACSDEIIDLFSRFRDAPRSYPYEVDKGVMPTPEDLEKAIVILGAYPEFDVDEMQRLILNDPVYVNNVTLEAAKTKYGRVPLRQNLDEVIRVDRGARRFFPRLGNRERDRRVGELVGILGDNRINSLEKLQGSSFFCLTTGASALGLVFYGIGGLYTGILGMILGGLMWVRGTSTLSKGQFYKALEERADYIDGVVDRAL